MRHQNKRSRWALYATAAAIALNVSAVNAQQQSDDADDEVFIEEVIVTATKRDEPLKQVALGITALKTEELFERQNLNLLDLSSQVPALDVQRVNPGLNRLILRGQNSGGSGASVAVLVDDVPFSFASGLSNGALLTAEIDLYDLAQVEVLRGPQGTLYGATAQGGLLKYVTAKPDTSDTYGAVEGGLESIDSGDLGFNVRGFTNVALSSKAALRVSGFYQGIAGFIDNPITGETNINSGEKYGGRFSVKIDPSEEFSILASGFYQKLETDGPTTVNVVGSPLGAAAAGPDQFDLVDGLSFGEFIPTTLANETYYGYLNLTYDFSAARIKSITSYGEISSVSNADSAGAPIAPGVTFGDFLGGAVFGQPIIGAQTDFSELRKFNQELQLASTEALSLGETTNLDWQLGVFYTQEDTELFQDFNALSRADLSPLQPDLGAVDAPGKYEEFSAFGEVAIHFTPQFDISIGGRFTNVTQSSQITYSAGVLTGIDQQLAEVQSDESVFTFSVAPRYIFDDGSVLYARVASGFRPGGPQLLIPGAPTDFPTSYTSDATLNYEIGFRSDLFDDMLSIDITAFLIDWTDIQLNTVFTSELTGIDFNVIGNGGQAETSGIEWNISLRPVEGLTLSNVGSFVDATLTSDAPAFGGQAGERLAFVPQISNSLNIDYKWVLSNGLEAFIGGTWSHTGNRFTDFGLTALSVTHTRLASYDTINLQAGIRSEDYFVQLYARNLTNEQALLGYSSIGAANLQGLAPILQPLTIGIRLGTNF